MCTLDFCKEITNGVLYVVIKISVCGFDPHATFKIQNAFDKDQRKSCMEDTEED